MLHIWDCIHTLAQHRLLLHEVVNFLMSMFREKRTMAHVRMIRGSSFVFWLPYVWMWKHTVSYRDVQIIWTLFLRSPQFEVAVSIHMPDLLNISSLYIWYFVHDPCVQQRVYSATQTHCRKHFGNTLPHIFTATTSPVPVRTHSLSFISYAYRVEKWHYKCFILTARCERTQRHAETHSSSTPGRQQLAQSFSNIIYHQMHGVRYGRTQQPHTRIEYNYVVLYPVDSDSDNDAPAQFVCWRHRRWQCQRCQRRRRPGPGADVVFVFVTRSGH